MMDYIVLSKESIPELVEKTKRSEWFFDKELTQAVLYNHQVVYFPARGDWYSVIIEKGYDVNFVMKTHRVFSEFEQ